MKPMDVVSSTTKVEDAEIDQESGKRLLEDTAPAATPAAPDSRRFFIHYNNFFNKFLTVSVSCYEVKR